MKRLMFAIAIGMSPLMVAAENKEIDELYPAAGQGGSWDAGFEVSVLSDDNVTRAQASGDIEDDTATRIAVDAQYALDFSLNQGLLFTGYLLDESYRDFEGISSVQAGLSAEYRLRTRAGFGAPVYAFFISNTQADYETDIRDGDTLDYGLRVSRQFTDRIAAAIGAGQSERTADGRVFDLEQTRYFVNLDYRVPNLFQTYLTYYSIDGDVYSISWVAPAAYGGGSGFYEATELDPAFSEARPHWAYRLDARTDVVRLGFSVSIDGDNAIDIAVDNISSESSNSVAYGSTPIVPGYGSGGGGGNTLTYDATIMSASYFYRF